MGILHNRALGRSIDPTPNTRPVVEIPVEKLYSEMTLAEKRRYNFAKARAAKAAKRAS
jgi:hypothetical protein